MMFNPPKAKHGAVPILGINLYADAALRDSHEVVAQVRRAMPPTLMSGSSRTQSGSSGIVPIRPSSAGKWPYTCVDIHLAHREMQALLRAMVPRVAAIEIGVPERLQNNILQSISRLRARLAAA